MRILGQLNKARLIEALKSAEPFNTEEGYVFTEAVNGTVSTDSNGSTWVTLPSGACRAVDLVNSSDAAIAYRRNGGGESMVVLPLSSRGIVGVTNSNQIQIRRLDQANTVTTIYFERLS